MTKPTKIEEIPKGQGPNVPIQKRWLQMGVELEGAWIKPRATVATLCRGAKAHDDHSVHIPRTPTADPGEIVTRPHDNLFGLLDDVSTLWPDMVDVSCGLHIHASFTPLDGSVIASTEFYEFLKKEWAAWGKEEKLPRSHEFWVRLRGGNKFAKDLFDPEKQLRAPARTREERYTMMNFNAWHKHGTIECRLLPMFQEKQVALSAIAKLASIYDTFLSMHGFVPITLEGSSNVVGKEVVEEYAYQTPDTTPQYTEFTTTAPRHVPTGDDIYYAIDGAQNDMLPFRKECGHTL